MSQRKIIVIDKTVKKTGFTRWGKPWTLTRLEAAAFGEDGQPALIDLGYELITFDDLPLNEEIVVDIEREDRVYRTKVYTSFKVSLPKEAKATDDAPIGDLPDADVVPAGYYALDVQNPTENGNDVMFVKVWRKHGRVKTYLVLGPNDNGRVLPVQSTLNRIVEAGPLDAAQRYGHLVKRCSTCHIRLTNRLSRELGIGPVCGKKFHDERWNDMRWGAIQSLRARGLDENETLSEQQWAHEERSTPIPTTKTKETA